MTLPDAQRCDMPGCDGPAVDPTGGTGLCREHHPDLDDDQDQDGHGDADDSGVTPAPVGDSPRSTPTSDGSEPPTRDGDTGVTREDAVAALRDTLEFYHRKVDEPINDHAEDGNHPERPDTAREYFTDVRGWDDATVDELLLGWAPPHHADELVAWLFGRGHSREAMLATGAIGERDSGSLYTTFSGRYVLPYFDSSGEPAYAIARVTGGEGGGAKGYGGHPADGFPGKYAKLRHTDDRVPLAEPIYGLDTLADADHVLVAEGIADAITARALGYAVLSPVARQFKREHYPPLVDALEEHGVERVTVVADADNHHIDEEAAEVNSIADVVDTTLTDIPAGKKGALRTASELRARTERLDVRVALPPAPADLTNDLDDWVTAWNGDIDTLFRAARPPEAFPAFSDAVGGTASGGEATRDDSDGSGERDDSGGEEDDGSLTKGDVEEALEHVSKSLPYDDWVQLAYAVHDWDSGPTGRRVFEDWSQQSPKWEDPTSSNAIEWVWNNATAGGQTTVATLVHRAKRGGWEPPTPSSTGDPDTEGDHRDDPREVGATVDPRRAWDAAGRVTPADLDEDSRHALDTDPDGETFTGPTGDSVGVVRAVALAEGLVDGDEPLQGDAWREAYTLAHEEYDAPLPEYYTTTDAVAEFDAVLDVIGEVTFWDLDTDALDSEITQEGDEVGGDAVRALNPVWRESESEASVLVFDSGTVWDADTERTLDALRFVALDSGLLDDPRYSLGGENFTEAYRRAREAYGAPLPRWDPADDGERHVTPQLPPAEDLLENGDLDGVDVGTLAAARDEVENLVREAAADGGTPTVIKSVPATGKTTGAIKTAAGATADEADGAPLSYLAPRNQLQQQALDKADRWGADAVLLPVFSDQQLDEEVLSRAVEHVREHGTNRLRDRWAIVDDALGDRETTPEALFADDEASDDEETVDLDRPTCDTADAEHGVAWALAVHVARALGYTPREIHQYDRALFGAPVPCSCDGDHDHEGDSRQDCEYTRGWEPVTDPDAPPDLLVGSYTHAHVESVRTHYTRQGDTDAVLREPRALVFDEYPGGAFETEYGEEATDFATWLAGCLREDVADAVDMHTRDLWGDEWVRAWLDGEGDEADSTVANAVRTLDRAESLLEAAQAARDVLDEQADDRLRGLSVYEPLSAVLDAPAEAFRNLDSAVSRKPAGRRDPLLEYLESAVLDPLATATANGRAAPDADAVGVHDLPAAGDLRALVADALDRLREGRDGARATLSAASAALRGGEEGCRRLAAWAEDGYAHPDAHHLLTAVAAPTGPDTDDAVGPRIDTDTWAFDSAATDGTVVDVVDTGERARTVLDRNGHGAILDTPPSRVSGGGDPAPVVGLDATARRTLWREVFHEAVSLADIHDSARERRQFLRETLDLRVLQAADKPRYYEGDPSTKDTVGDAALLRRLSDEYAGIEAPRTRDDDPTVVGRPAAITTKQVRDVLQNSELVGDSVAAWENFGNLTGANDLGEHRLAAVLGCQHFGDDAVERFAALAGESVDTDRAGGRGGALEYGSHAADEYLAHMRDDQTMQAVLRFARGDSGATVLARTSALREDLPVVGEAQVVGTWSDTARRVAQRWRELGEPFTAADVADAVDVSLRHVRRVLGELADSGYLDREHTGPGRANVYDPVAQPGAGEVELPDRDDAVASSAGSTDDPGRDGFSIPYTWNVRVAPGEYDSRDSTPGRTGVIPGAPPAPRAAEAGPPDD